MSEPAQGGVRPDSSGIDFTDMIAAAKSGAEAVTATWTGAAASVPGVGALMDLTDNRLGNNLRPTGADDAPRVGEGLGMAAPDAPNQSGAGRTTPRP